MSSKRCHSCLEPNQDNYPCPHCNWSPDTPSKWPVTLKPGTLLHGRYELGDVLSHGEFNTTYLAWNIKEQKKIAIKEYLPVELVDRNTTTCSVIIKSTPRTFNYGLERFLDEALTLTKFQKHPNIVSVLSLFKANETGYMVMEYLQGNTLDRYIKSKGLLNWSQTLALFSRIMSILDAMHKQNLLHSAISPENIYLCKNNQVKLLGFAEAKNALNMQMVSFSSLNKPGYAAEEQYYSNSPKGPWTDVYAVAASMYFCLTGQSPPEALLRKNSDTLIKPSLLNVDIPVTAELALLRGLAVQTSLRPQTIEQFYYSLIRARQDAKTAAAETINKPIAETAPKQAEVKVSTDTSTVADDAALPDDNSSALKLLAGLLLTLFVLAVIIVIKKTPNRQVTAPSDAKSAGEQTNAENTTRLYNHAVTLKRQGRDELALPIFAHLARQGHSDAQAALDSMSAQGKVAHVDEKLSTPEAAAEAVSTPSTEIKLSKNAAIVDSRIQTKPQTILPDNATKLKKIAPHFNLNVLDQENYVVEDHQQTFFKLANT
ncbi:MAG: serine/threonine-protein kinase, partial [Methylococcales bacterium]